MASAEVEDIIDKFTVFTQKPVKFLSVQENIKDDIKTLVKSLYDYTKSQEKSDVKKDKKVALPELIVKDFDEEQIWQEIELQNSECLDNLVWEVANYMSDKNALEFPIDVPKSDDNEVEDCAETSEDHMSDSEHKEAKKVKSSNKMSKSKLRTSVVDDKFFKLQEMEQFLLKEERKQGKETVSDSDNESIDMFEDIDDEDIDGDEGVKAVKYDDFFSGQDGEQEYQYEGEDDEQSFGDNSDAETEYKQVEHKKREKKVKFAGLVSDDESSSEGSIDSETGKGAKDNLQKDDKKSDFEKRQQRLQQHISKLEEKAVTEAPWQLKGEVDASKRPQNSLLQEVVDFDMTSRPPPIITEQTTITLEDIIRQRIKDKAWDDVAKKEKAVDDQLKFRKTETLDQSKSKVSLAQIYEAEYIKQKQSKSGENEEEKEPEDHIQIRDAMKKLFSKLDALCHYHYTPKAATAEIKIISNTPAISMEEVAPVATSDAALLAPEEVKKKRKGDLMSKEERTQTDKKRERRKKKILQRKKGKVIKVTEHRNTKKSVEASDKSLKTSKAFFQQLNDNTNSLIKKNKRNIKKNGQ